jgi:membrane protease YdiL (CAAX protease family)
MVLESTRAGSQSVRWLRYVIVVALLGRFWDSAHAFLIISLLQMVHLWSMPFERFDYALLVFVRDAGYAALVMYGYRYLIAEPPSELGLKRFAWWHVALGAVCAGVLFVAMPVLMHPLHLHRTAASLYLSHTLHVSGWVTSALLFYDIAIFSPVFQEIYFRGALLRALSLTMPAWASVGLGALIFAFWHFTGGAHQIVQTFIFGIVAGVLYLRTRNLAAPIAMHIVSNGMFMITELHR